ncbi:DNA mismatch repair protein Mlh1 [Hordeum vulgare]|nr:DNA mismatch repair protein Mlh1 [Hordeum vulgare]
MPHFGLRILKEQFPKGFTLARDTCKYNGSTKPEDWLTDYTTVVGIADGNKRLVSSMELLVLVDTVGKSTLVKQAAAPVAGRSKLAQGNRKTDQPDARYGSQQVAAVEDGKMAHRPSFSRH